jgi:hypothetical protein
MNAFSEINLRPTKRDFVQFALVIGVFGSAAGAIAHFGYKHTELAGVIWWATAAALGASVVPGLNRALYIAWMGLGATLGMITGPIVMLAIYLVLFTPMALIFRLARRDAMHRTIERSAKSYWTPHARNTNVSRYYKQY